MQEYKCISVGLNANFFQVFVDYAAQELNVQLKIKQINECFSNTPQFELWLLSQDIKLEAEVMQAFVDYQINPADKKYRLASWHFGQVTPMATQSDPHNSLLADLRMQARPLTTLLVVMTLIVFCMQYFNPIKTNLLLFFPSTIEQYTEYWRYISHAFLHFGLFHLVVNLMWLWYLGCQIERHIGTFKLFTLFLISAIISGLAQDWVAGHQFGGLSGVVYALTGYCWLYGMVLPHKKVSLPTIILVLSLIWIVIGNIPFFNLRIGNTAHFAGLMVGLLIGLFDILMIKFNITLFKVRSK